VKSYANKNLSILPQWAQDYIKDLKYEIDRLQAIKEMHAILTEKNRTWFTLPGPENHSDREVIKLWVFNRDDPLQVAVLFPGDKLFIGRKREEVYHESQKAKEDGRQGQGEAGTVSKRGRSTRSSKGVTGKK
jgi:hypothetical protein